jgi:hypothetical protein
MVVVFASSAVLRPVAHRAYAYSTSTFSPTQSQAQARTAALPTGLPPTKSPKPGPSVSPPSCVWGCLRVLTRWLWRVWVQSGSLRDTPIGSGCAPPPLCLWSTCPQPLRSRCTPLPIPIPIRSALRRTCRRARGRRRRLPPPHRSALCLCRQPPLRRPLRFTARLLPLPLLPPSRPAL